MAELITESWPGSNGAKYVFEYSEADSFNELPYEACRQCYGVCFYGDKMVIGFGGKKNAWGLIGGTIEPGETFEDTLKREIKEESNMEILAFKPIGYQRVIDHPVPGSSIFQLRFICIVKPFGPFISDPAGGITEIKLIDPAEYKKYFDWGKIGETIIERALKLNAQLQ